MLLSAKRSVHYRSPWRCEHPYRASKHVTVRCRRRDCRGCGRWWAHDQREKVLRNLAAYLGHVAIVTITAPGQDVLPWDGERCWAGPLRRWNSTAPARWRELHHAAMKRTRRAVPAGDWVVLASVWQEQRRGALHRHLVVPMATPQERAVSAVYVAALHALAREHGFGFVDRKLELRSPDRGARYLGRYVTSELAMCRELPAHVVQVSRRLTARTRCTVRSLRAERRQWCLDRPRARLDSEGPVQVPERLFEPVRVAVVRPKRLYRSQRPRPPDEWGIAVTQAELHRTWGPILAPA